MPLPKNVEAKETGHATMLDRAKAFRKLINELSEFMGEDQEGYTEKAQQFVDEWWERFDDLAEENLHTVTVSARQYFWAKDLYDKHCVGA